MNELIVAGEREQVYLGDGLYASFDGYQIWLRTSDGLSVTNTIALEPQVMKALSDYAAKVFQK